MDALKSQVERIVFRTPLVTVGTFRCPTAHPLFRDSGPSNACCFVFPRTSVWIRRAGEPPFVADPGVVTFYDEGQEYSRRPISPDGDRAEWFGIAPEVAADVLGAAGGSRIFRRSHTAVPPRLYAGQRRLVERAAAGEVEPLEVEEEVIALLAAVTPATTASARPTGSPPRRDFTSDVREVVGTTLGERVTLSELAARLGCSVFHLCHRFKQTTGTTIHAYRRDLRLRSSLERLREQDLSALALDLGFSSHSHFTSAFRRHFGITPSAWRRGQPAVSSRISGEPL